MAGVRVLPTSTDRCKGHLCGSGHRSHTSRTYESMSNMYIQHSYNNGSVGGPTIRLGSENYQNISTCLIDKLRGRCIVD